MRIIFHIPFKIDKARPSGTNIRPLRMLNAFKGIGGQVDVVMGYGKTRKRQIKQIKDRIKKGVKYHFLYSESSTSPTLLTEKNNLPQYPLLDFGFFRFCKKKGIKLGLYYRDFHWNFKAYKQEKPFIKRAIIKLFGKYDLFQYKKLVDILFLQTIKMAEYMPITFRGSIKPLPPGVNNTKVEPVYDADDLSFIYIGGIGAFYNLELFLKSFFNFPELSFTLCTRKDEWGHNQKKYHPYLNTNVSVVHDQGDQLKKIYNKSQIAILFLKPISYYEFCLPLKLFEYISYQKPVIGVKGTAVGNFIEKYNIGWTSEYKEKHLIRLLERLKKNREEIMEKVENIEKILKLHTWEERARSVVKEFEKLIN